VDENYVLGQRFSAETPTLFASETSLRIALIVMISGAVALAVHCFIGAIRMRSLIPIYAIVGGVVALPIEPFWDVNVLFTFATNSHPIAFHAFGRAIPLYLAFIYPLFIGWGSFFTYSIISRGSTVRQIAWIPVGFAVFDFAIEIAGCKADLWTYYGGYTFTILGWPLAFGFLNGMIPLLGGAAFAAVSSAPLGKVKWFAYLFVVPSAYVGIYAVAGWPVWWTLNAGLPRFVDWVAGAALFIICFVVARLVLWTLDNRARNHFPEGVSSSLSGRVQHSAESLPSLGSP
jgi:hypothetical protein